MTTSGEASLAVPFIRGAKVDDPEHPDRYPYRIPAIQHIEDISFNQPVTFLVGENGSGKSTIIEAMALAAGFNAEGGTKNFRRTTHHNTSELIASMRLIRNPRKEQDGYFLRAESFYNVATEAEEYGDRSLHRQSHGESFLAIANGRFLGDSLFFLDEPEAALSPQRQLSFMARMHRLIDADCQFIVATHSPILMAYPGAAIYQLGENGVSQVAYEETEHYRLSLDFLSNHQRYIERLFHGGSE
jgi:predicted ATPase